MASHSGSSKRLVIGSSLLVLVLLLGGLTMGAFYPSDELGAERCRTCHKREHKIWSKSAHAGAWASLGSKRGRRECQTCHTLGARPHLRGVQCESCHGPGRYYAMRIVMLDRRLARAAGLRIPRGRKLCLGCHNRGGPRLRKFDHRKMWAKMAHGGRKRR